MKKNIDSQLSKIVGEENVATDAFERMLYSHDVAPLPSLLSSAFKTMPDAITRPESSEEIAQIMRWASEHGVPVVPRAAASYALGGVIPTKGGIVLDLVKLNRIGELSVDESWVEVEAGVVFKDLMAYLSDKGLAVLSCPTSAPSSTVGGWVSTGGKGLGSLKYGPISEQVIELEIVTPTGEIMRVSKDSTHPKINWFFGTEGQFGVITKVKLGIRKQPEKQIVRGLYTTGHKELAELVDELKGIPYVLIALDSDLMSFKDKLHDRKTEGKNLLLAVFEGTEEDVNSAVSAFDRILKQRGLQDIGEDLAMEEWEERYHPMGIGKLGPTLLSGEFSVPIDQLQPVLDKIKALQKKSDMKIGVEVQVISQESALVLAMYLTDERKPIKYFTHLALVSDINNIGFSHRGQPYGMGIWNSFSLKKLYSKEYIKKLKRAKKELDPKGIMNPGKFFKAETRFGISIPPILFDTSMKALSFARRFL